MKPWLDKADGYKVERIPCPAPGGSVDLSIPPQGVMHTTEGSWDSALAVFKQHYAPNFLVGAGRIAQLVPLGAMAAALEHNAPPETNRWARAQIEVVGFSKETPYSFDARTTDALAALLAALYTAAGIPLSRPFVDQMPAKPWATTSFSRRHAGKWGKVAGWYGHVEIPGNSHWDPGALEWKPLLAAAHAKLAPEPPHVPAGPVKTPTAPQVAFDNLNIPPVGPLAVDGPEGSAIIKRGSVLRVQRILPSLIRRYGAVTIRKVADG